MAATARMVGRVCGLAESADAELLRRYAGSGDDRAFAELVRRHGPAVAATCRRLLGDGPDAEDAAQATWLILSRRAGQLSDPAAVAGWLHGTANRVARQVQRTSARRTAREANVIPRQPVGSEEETCFRETVAVIDEELARLPEPERAALILCGLEGMPRSVTAARLGITVSTLKGRLETARRRLRERLRHRGIPASVALAALAVESRGWAGFAPTGRAATLAAEVSGHHAIRFASAATALGLIVAGGFGLLSGGGPSSTNGDPPAAERADRFGDPLPDGAVARLGTVRFRHHAPVVNAVGFRDGNRIATRAGDHVYIWNAADGKPIHRWKVEDDWQVFKLGQLDRPLLAVTPDGRRFATVDKEHVIRLWDVDTGKPVREFRGHGDQAAGDDSNTGPFHRPGRLRFAADGERLISLGLDGTLRVWETVTGIELFRLGQFDGRLRRMAAAADGRVIAAMAAGETRRESEVVIWRPDTGELTKLPARTDLLHSMAISPDGRRLALPENIEVGVEPRFEIWDIRAARPAVLHAIIKPRACPGHFAGRQVDRHLRG